MSKLYLGDKLVVDGDKLDKIVTVELKDLDKSDIDISDIDYDGVLLFGSNAAISNLINLFKNKKVEIANIKFKIRLKSKNNTSGYIIPIWFSINIPVSFSSKFLIGYFNIRQFDGGTSNEVFNIENYKIIFSEVGTFLYKIDQSSIINTAPITNITLNTDKTFEDAEVYKNIKYNTNINVNAHKFTKYISVSLAINDVAGVHYVLLSPSLVNTTGSDRVYYTGSFFVDENKTLQEYKVILERGTSENQCKLKVTRIYETVIEHVNISNITLGTVLEFKNSVLYDIINTGYVGNKGKFISAALTINTIEGKQNVLLSSYIDKYNKLNYTGRFNRGLQDYRVDLYNSGVLDHCNIKVTKVENTSSSSTSPNNITEIDCPTYIAVNNDANGIIQNSETGYEITDSSFRSKFNNAAAHGYNILAKFTLTHTVGGTTLNSSIRAILEYSRQGEIYVGHFGTAFIDELYYAIAILTRTEDDGSEKIYLNIIPFKDYLGIDDSSGSSNNIVEINCATSIPVTVTIDTEQISAQIEDNDFNTAFNNAVRDGYNVLAQFVLTANNGIETSNFTIKPLLEYTRLDTDTPYYQGMTNISSIPYLVSITTTNSEDGSQVRTLSLVKLHYYLNALSPDVAQNKLVELTNSVYLSSTSTSDIENESFSLDENTDFISEFENAKGHGYNIIAKFEITQTINNEGKTSIIKPFLEFNGLEFKEAYRGTTYINSIPYLVSIIVTYNEENSTYSYSLNLVKLRNSLNNSKIAPIIKVSTIFDWPSRIENMFESEFSFDDEAHNAIINIVQGNDPDNVLYPITFTFGAYSSYNGTTDKRTRDVTILFTKYELNNIGSWYSTVLVGTFIDYEDIENSRKPRIYRLSFKCVDDMYVYLGFSFFKEDEDEYKVIPINNIINIPENSNSEITSISNSTMQEIITNTSDINKIFPIRLTFKGKGHSSTNKNLNSYTINFTKKFNETGDSTNTYTNSYLIGSFVDDNLLYPDPRSEFQVILAYNEKANKIDVTVTALPKPTPTIELTPLLNSITNIEPIILTSYDIQKGLNNIKIKLSDNDIIFPACVYTEEITGTNSYTRYYTEEISFSYNGIDYLFQMDTNFDTNQAVYYLQFNICKKQYNNVYEVYEETQDTESYWSAIGGKKLKDVKLHDIIICNGTIYKVIGFNYNKQPTDTIIVFNAMNVLIPSGDLELNVRILNWQGDNYYYADYGKYLLTRQ